MLVQSPYYQLLKEADQYKLAGKFEEAINLCQQILCEDLNCTEAYEELADNYMNLRQYDKAIRALHTALKLNPNSANAHYLLGFSYSSTSDWKLSCEHLEIANKLETNHPEILRCLGWSIFHTGRHKQGLIILNRAVNMAPHDCFILSDLGMCYLSIRKFKEAQKTFEHVLSIEPNNTRAHECLEACKYFKSRTKKEQ